MALDPVKNFAKVVVSTGYDDNDTSIVLETDEGAKLPAPATDGAFNVVWYNSSDYSDPGDDPNVEIVRVIARSTDTLTITRAQEDTTAKTHNTAGKVYKMVLAMTKKMIDDIPTYADSKVEDSITDGHTDIAPSGNAVFDALALKAPVKSTGSTSDASSITPTGNYPENEYYVTALAQALTINAPSGTAVNGNTLLFRIKDNGTARALTWNAAYTFIGTTKPDTTVAGKIIYIGAIYNSTATKWEVVSINQEA